MAKDTTVRVELTKALVAGLEFNSPVVGLTPNGALITGELAPKTKDWVLRDKSLPGFMVRVYASKKVFQVQRKMTSRLDPIDALNSAPIKRVVGTVGELSVADARKTAQHWLGLMAKGIDPLQQLRAEAKAQARERARDAKTFGVFYESYMNDTDGVSAATASDRQKIPKWMEKSPLWRVPMHELEFEAVDNAISPLFRSALGSEKKPAWGPVKPGLATAWKIYRYCSAAYTSYVGQQGLEFARGTSPFATVRKKRKWPATSARTTFLDAEEESNRNWLIRLVAMRDEPSPSLSVFADFLLIALIWGGRRRETQLVQWEHLDLEKGVGRFVAANTKGKRDHYFPLTPWAIEILTRRRERNKETGRDYDWVFPSVHHDKPISDHGAALEALKKETGVWLTAHDLRRTVATETAELTGIDSLTVSLTLAHSGGNASRTQRYIQSRVKLLRPIFEQRERRLRELAGLQTIAAESSPIDTLIEFLQTAKDDPAERTAISKKVEGILLMLK